MVVALDPDRDIAAGEAAPDLRSRAAFEGDLPVPPGRGPLTWLHLSDLHFGSTREVLAEAALDALVRDIARPEVSVPKPDLIFVTGDVAWHGRPAEYDRAAFFLHRLGEATGLDLRTRCFVVPGNHDVNRDVARRFGARSMVDALRGIEDPAELVKSLDELVSDPSQIRVLGERQQAFFEWCEWMSLPTRLAPERPWWSGLAAEVNGWDVGVLCLNTAWTSRDDQDRGRLVLGRPQVTELLEATRTADVRIALMHHPLTDLSEADRKVVRGILRERVDFVLRGHLHEADLERAVTPDGARTTFAAGATWAGHAWKNGFLTVTLRPDTDTADVEAWAYGGGVDGWWRRDVFAWKGAPEGRWSTPLPETLRSGRGHEEVGAATWEAVRRQTLAVHGHVRFVGLPSTAGRVHDASLGEAFVPLRLSGRRDGGERSPAPTVTLTELLPELRRAVILGPPGSGKSTLAQALLLWAWGGLDLGVAPSGPAFLLRLRDVEGVDLVDAVCHDLRARLQVGLDRAAVEAALQGGALLVLDGLDEGGDEGRRTALRDAVTALAAAWPKARIIVTFRPVGYDRNRLPEAEFVEYTIAPFDDVEQERFVRAWYTGREVDPVERERGIRDLLGALAASPSVRELARNPLLATLIALVHRTEARLPGERAQVLELAVKLLLDSWVTGRRAGFCRLNAGQQRAVLEDLAWRMQNTRKDARIVQTRRTLEAWLAASIADRGYAPAGATADELASAWVEHLVVTTGIVIEESPGRFRFLHLLLLEYLAAVHLYRQGAEAVRAAWEEHLFDEEWEEVLVLALGYAPEDRDDKPNPPPTAAPSG